MIRPSFIPKASVLICFFVSVVGLGAQETAASFFDRMSERYQSISDYSANITITRRNTSGANQIQQATLMFKEPGLLRLDFSQPEGMVLAVDNEILKVWVPDYGVTFTQPLRRDGQAGLASTATPQGLALMRRDFTIAYDQSPTPVPLEDGSTEMVVRLRLYWKSNSDGFKYLYLSVDEDLKIRRIEGVTTTNESIIFDFTNMILNQGIPDARFSYTAPPEGNQIENFLFDPENSL